MMDHQLLSKGSSAIRMTMNHHIMRMSRSFSFVVVVVVVLLSFCTTTHRTTVVGFSPTTTRRTTTRTTTANTIPKISSNLPWLLSVQRQQQQQKQKSQRHNSILCSMSSSSSSINESNRNNNNNNKDTTTISSQQQQQPPPLRIAIVGAGPSGALLANLLLQSKQQQNDDSKSNNHNSTTKNNNNIQITVLEGRSDPRRNIVVQKFAYALGIGIRGRTAIRQVNEHLWKTIKSRGYESERFQLHIELFNKNFIIPLRSEKDSISKNSNNDGTTTTTTKADPSLLIYQSQLCAALIEELERYNNNNQNSNNDDTITNNGNLQMYFNTKVVKCNAETMMIEIENNSNNSNNQQPQPQHEEGSLLGPFDLIVGCDGVNSIVRSTMKEVYPEFETIKTPLSGQFKVVRLDSIPPQMDPKAVSLVLPKKGGSSTTAFVEPINTNGECCILFDTKQPPQPQPQQGQEEEGSQQPQEAFSLVSETKNKTAILESLEQSFPQWKEIHDTIATQLMSQTVAGTASSVVCNTYHFTNANANANANTKLVLVGDAAHATGGVSGQGVNSALADAAVLANCILQEYNNNCQQQQQQQSLSLSESLNQALLSYSKRQVPEGKALYDLSFGPPKQQKTVTKAIQYAFITVRDTIFRGRWGIGNPPLQTRITLNMTPFSDIRREMDEFYDQPFPTREEFDTMLETLHYQQAGLKAGTVTTSSSTAMAATTTDTQSSAAA